MRYGVLAGTFTAIACSALACPRTVSDPLLGRWHETAWVDCATGEAQAPDDPIRELLFRPNGTLTVTWHPIETYVDYRARYEQPEPGALSMVITWSAYEPGDFDGEGTYWIDDTGSLHLEEIWLGSPRGRQGHHGCGHRFDRVE
jgi:hypothetical protein